MLGDCESTLSVPELELETLRSIYVNELEVDHNANGAPVSVALWLHPATADNVEEQYVRIYLIFKLSQNYPEDVPKICIRNPRGLSDEQINRIIEKLLCIAENSKGAAMLFELIEAAKEQLTAENRPNENCAICLYGFLDEDVFTKTECYHYFHSHCLNRYVKCKLEEANAKEESACATNGDSNKILCPVCRVPITFTTKEEDFPEPLAVAAACILLHNTHSKHQQEMDELYQKQLAQGGIIDIEAEKNKFLLEIANVPTDKALEVKEVIDDVAQETQLEHSESSTMPAKGKKSPIASPSFKNRNSKYNPRGGYRQPYRRKSDRSYDTRELGRCHSNRSQANLNTHTECSSVNANRVLPTSEQPKESVIGGIHQSDSQDDNKNNVTDNQSPRSSGTKGQHNPGFKNVHNHKSQRNFSDGQWKLRGGNKRYSEGRRSYDSPSHMQRSSDVPEEKFHDKKVVTDKGPESNEPLAKVPGQSKHSSMSDRRPNYRTGPRFHGGRSYHHGRFPKYNENFYNEPNSTSCNITEHGETEQIVSTCDRNVNARPYRGRFQEPQRRYNGQSRPNRPNADNYYSNHDSRNNDYQGHHQFGPTRSYPNHSSRYRGNSYNPNKKWNERERNGNLNPKSAVNTTDSKQVNAQCEEVREDLSKTHIDNQSSVNPAKGKGQPIVCTKLSDNSLEKCGPMVRPPPGFANPLKKVVYGLPSLNPPPGFGSS